LGTLCHRLKAAVPVATVNVAVAPLRDGGIKAANVRFATFMTES
jgi:hypothetical protein